MFSELHLHDLHITSKTGAPLYELTRPLRFRTRLGGDGLKVNVPRGFITDFASIPRFLWWLFPPNGKWSRAAVVHDYLYRRRGCSRFLADALFREAMADDGVPTVTRVTMYYAVRCFGSHAYGSRLES